MQKRKSIFLSLLVILVCFISLFATNANAAQVNDQPSDGIIVSAEEDYCGCCHEHNHSGFFSKISCIFCKITMFFKGIFGKAEENPQHKYALTSERAATCAVAGNKVYTCLVCDKTETYTFDKLEHTPIVMPAKEPTCTATGLTEGSKCAVCRKVLTAQKKIEKRGHTLVQVNAQPADCKNSGWKAYEYCAMCDYTTYAELVALGHTATVDVAVAPTCTATGLSEGKHCSVCNEVLVPQNIVPALGHAQAIEPAVAPTCTTTGLTEGKYCPVCDAVLAAQETVAALGHTAAEAVVENNIAPTCTDKGSFDSVVYCSVCDAQLSREKNEIPANGHTDGAAATCTQAQTCTVCQAVLTAALGHTEVTDAAVAPTCTATGLTEGKHCSVCNEVLTARETVSALGHTDGAAATCTQAQTCTVCQAVLTAAFGHTEVTDAAVAPTCTATGLTEGKHCSVCNEVLTAQETVSALGHTAASAVKENEVAPDCENAGAYDSVVYCSVCGAQLSREKKVIPANGHIAGAAATCTTAQTCTVCQKVLAIAKGHTEVVDNAMAPTCTATGLTEGKHCSVCKAVLIAQSVVPAKGHTEVVDAAVAPTCTATGLTEGKHCSVCNVVLAAQSVVPAKGHTEVVDAAVAPTCTATGLTEGKHCSACNAVLSAQNVVPARGHEHSIIFDVVGYAYNHATNAGKNTIVYSCTRCNDQKNVTTSDYAAIIENNNGITLYSTVDSALAASVSGDTVAVIKDAVLGANATVPAGVMLLIPCDNVMTAYMENGYNPDLNAKSGTAFLYRSLTVPAGVRLTVEGTLLVNAVTSRMEGGSVAGYGNSGAYGQIILGGEIVVNDGGILDCSGYVLNNGGQTTLKAGGTMYETYDVVKWRGGSFAARYAVLSKYKYYPIYESHMRNLQADLRIEYGAELFATGKMYGNDEYNYVRNPQISNYSKADCNAIIRLKEDSYVVREIDTVNNREIYNFYGDIAFVRSSMKIEYLGISYDLSSDKADFYQYDGDMTFNFYTGNFSIEESFSFLPGGEVHIYEGANVVCKANAGFAMFDQGFYDHDGKSMAEAYQYTKERPNAFLKIHAGGILDASVSKAELLGDIYVANDENLKLSASATTSYTFTVPNDPKVTAFSGTTGDYVLVLNQKPVAE